VGVLRLTRWPRARRAVAALAAAWCLMVAGAWLAWGLGYGLLLGGALAAAYFVVLYDADDPPPPPDPVVGAAWPHLGDPNA
jgi:hypothetical protein